LKFIAESDTIPSNLVFHASGGCSGSHADQTGSLPHNTKVFNLCLIKKMGVEAWAKHKAKSVKEAYFRGKWRM
jgi:hypothetical protein